MVPNFPSPVLCLAVDSLKDIDGGDALSGLWSIFTRCKGSLQDGRRLENISWRLWYRQLSTRSEPLAIVYHSPEVNSAPCYPLTPVSERGIDRPGSRPVSPTSRDLERATHTNDGTGFPSSASTSTVRFKPVSSVGKIICDIIPDKFDLASTKPSPAFALLKPDLVIVAADPGAMVVAPIPSMLLPPPSTQPPSVAAFPRVVVVNPTPHPTPPATPVPSGPPTPLPPTGQHLAPPSRVSAAVLRHNSPDATTPANPVPTPTQPPLPLPPPSLVPMAAALVPPPQPQSQSQPKLQPKFQHLRHLDGTLKPSDRRFFLQQDQSPSPERDCPDRGSNGSISTGKSPSETGEPQPSSVTSNQTRTSTASASSHPTNRGRRNKNVPVRPPMTRLNSGRHVMQVMRKEPAKARATSHQNPDKTAKVAGPSRPPRTPAVEPQPPAKTQTHRTNGAIASQVPNLHAPPPSAAPRRGIVVSHSSSEYETTDTDEEDDDSWASEDISEGVADPARTVTDKCPPTKEDSGLREAALEAQRQRELFVKQPKRSYSNLGRTQSGLLSQLLNPDPNMLPHRVASTHDVTRSGIPSALTSGKSSAAHPLAAQVTAQAPLAAATSSGHGGYRPKGRPQGEELEDDSDSPEDPDDTIQVSRSLAQQRLAALANPSRRRASDNQVPTQGSSTMARPILPTIATAPIPLNHPWNLPAPAPPTTPRTTRRQMLATELSESLRRNLLWERQVSKTNLLGNGRRNALGGSGAGAGSGLRPLAAVVNSNGNAQAGPSQQHQQAHQDPGKDAEESIAERRRRALARNRTWADDFHYAGW